MDVERLASYYYSLLISAAMMGSSNQIMSARRYHPGRAKSRCPPSLESVPLTTLHQQRQSCFGRLACVVSVARIDVNEASGATKKILIVEDDLNSCVGLRNSLAQQGYEVATAANSFEAVMKMKADVSIGIFDLDLPASVLRSAAGILSESSGGHCSRSSS